MANWANRIRVGLTTRLTRAAVAAAPRLAPATLDALEGLIGRTGPHVPLLARVVADNMRSAGVYSPQAHREYFARAAGHLGGVLRVFRQAGRAGKASAGPIHAELDHVVRQRVRLDDSFDILRGAAAAGKGVVLMGVHASNYVLVLARINQEVPITVYLRHSRDPHKQAAKRAVCAATGLDFIAEPPGLLNPGRRAELMAAALKEGRTLIITPDLAQKREQGVPVRFLDREVYLPGGPAAIALLVEAPLLTVVGTPVSHGRASSNAARSADADRSITLRFFGPKSTEVTDRRRGWRREAVRERIQWFADVFADEFLRPHPSLWFLWADKRWTRVFRGDHRYTRPLQEPRTEN